jgi:peptide deformylase
MIITNNEEALRVFCEEVKQEEVADLVTTLENELAYANRLGKGGIGLAAPQIGIAKHIAIVRLGNGLSFNLVNAKLEIGYDPTTFKEEGCLSFPGRVEDTTRFQEVVISNFVSPEKFTATGLVAVVCQHELDHLNSTLFMDRKLVKTSPIIVKGKIGPNQPCTCGSGKKYKKCCAKNT